VQWGSLLRTSIAAVGAVFIAQAGFLLQFPNFSLACFEIYPSSQHSGSIVDCESYNHIINPVHNLWFQSPCFFQMCLCISKRPIGLIGYFVQLPCLALYSVSPRYLISLDSWIVSLERVVSISILIFLFVVKYIITVVLILDNLILAHCWLQELQHGWRQFLVG
jgi:hypothetical protein